MDPSRKRAIRLTVALTAALLLASALVWTSFSAGRDELTASQLLKRAHPGQSYILAGTVLDGSVSHQGEALLFRVRDPKLKVIPEVERELVIQALKETNGNQVHAAKMLGITRATLRKRVEKFAIQRELSIK